MGKGLVHVLDLDSPAKKPKVQVFSIKRACPSCGTSFSELDPRLFSFNSKHGWCEGCFGTGLALEGFDEEQSGEETSWNEWLEGEAHTCETCHGQRLNPVALHVRFRDLNIADLTHQAIDETVTFVSKLRLTKREAEIARDLMAEIKAGKVADTAPERRKVVKRHRKCKGCTCQHVVQVEAAPGQPVTDQVPTAGAE
jgi:excinuclease ABC subunit A